MIITYGDEELESFLLFNGMSVEIDYGIKDDELNPPYFFGLGRTVGLLRRSKLIDASGKLITEIIEDNPDQVSDEKEERLCRENIRIGDEYEKIVNFPNGMQFKVEYWVTPENRDKHFGRFDAKFRKLILLDENNEIIFEVLEKNPKYINPNIPDIGTNVDDDILY